METMYEKVDDTTLKVTKPVEVQTEETVYDLDFLESQLEAIARQKEEFVKARDLELEEIKILISKCKELNIQSKALVDFEVIK